MSTNPGNNPSETLEFQLSPCHMLQQGDTELQPQVFLQVEEAVAHFVKAGCGDKAIEVCINARLWRKARQLLKGQKDPAAMEQLLAVAKQLDEQGDLSEAEQAYLEVRPYPRIEHSTQVRGSTFQAMASCRFPFGHVGGNDRAVTCAGKRSGESCEDARGPWAADGSFEGKQMPKPVHWVTTPRHPHAEARHPNLARFALHAVAH